MAGQLCRDDASLYMQTHVAENRAEVEWVASPRRARSYLDVYDAPACCTSAPCWLMASLAR